jgi:hypothetical protein
MGGICSSFKGTKTVFENPKAKVKSGKNIKEPIIEEKDAVKVETKSVEKEEAITE